MSSDFLGAGWSFPIASTDQGAIGEASGADSIQQSIWLILSTSRGERVMRPDFGCGLYDLVFGLNDAATVGEAQRAVREALVLWEPRIDMIDVRAAPDPARPNVLLIEIVYQVRQTNSRYNLVYPFYLE
jgi:uncharacterized protein